MDKLMMEYVLFLAWAVIRNIVLLELLRNVVGCGEVRPPVAANVEETLILAARHEYARLTISMRNPDLGRSLVKAIM